MCSISRDDDYLFKSFSSNFSSFPHIFLRTFCAWLCVCVCVIWFSFNPSNAFSLAISFLYVSFERSSFNLFASAVWCYYNVNRWMVARVCIALVYVCVKDASRSNVATEWKNGRQINILYIYSATNADQKLNVPYSSIEMMMWWWRATDDENRSCILSSVAVKCLMNRYTVADADANEQKRKKIGTKWKEHFSNEFWYDAVAHIAHYELASNRTKTHGHGILYVNVIAPIPNELRFGIRIFQFISAERCHPLFSVFHAAKYVRTIERWKLLTLDITCDKHEK